MWNSVKIILHFQEQLKLVDRQLRDQQGYAGIDSYSEVKLHPLLSQHVADFAYGIHREVGYPTSPLIRPNNAQRQRCDLVLTPENNRAIFDPIDEQRTQDRAVGTLFETVALDRQPSADQVLPTQAYWIEIKAIAQFRYVDGVPGPNSSYTSELLTGPRVDVIKLASDPQIRHGASLVVLFTQEQDAGRHDIAALSQSLLDLDLPISVPEIESFAISNHAGNEWCTLGLIPLRL